MRKEDEAIFDALTDEQLFALNMEREAGGEPREGKIAVGTVVLERVDHRDWDGNTIREVILLPTQFTWTMPEYGKAYYVNAVKMAKNFEGSLITHPALAECFEIAKGMLSGKIPRDPDLAAMHCCQYLNPEVAASAKKRWERLGYQVVKTIGNHEFFAK